MDFYVILFTGSVCFVCMVLLKLIMKRAVVNMKTDVSEKTITAFVYIMVFIFCFIVYVLILNNLSFRHDMRWHFKLCYVIKAWTISLSLNSVYEQLFLAPDPWSEKSEGLEK